MAAQTVKIMSVAEAKAMVAGGKQIRSNTWALVSQGVTVTFHSAPGGNVKAIIVKGCHC